MRRFIIDYGEFTGHALSEVSDECLAELAARFPLSTQSYEASDGETQLILSLCMRKRRAPRMAADVRNISLPSVASHPRS